jgi:hypothetical protein
MIIALILPESLQRSTILNLPVCFRVKTCDS